MDKKIAAAISGVLAYIKSQEELVLANQDISNINNLDNLNNQDQLSLNQNYNVWGLNGRQSQMQMRNLMQFKAFHKKF